MQAEALIGGFDDPARDAARAFRAALDALARPGTIRRIAGGRGPAPLSPAAATLLLVLCDGDTPLHLAGDHDRPELRDWVAFHLGAPLVGPAEASFAIGEWTALGPLGAYAIGTPEDPDRSATLIVECDRLVAEGARLTGPGIATENRLSLPEPEALATNADRFPLGVDLFLTCGDRVAGLPRSTRVEAG
ncbi:Alpha-D-ribose 1-methylphosphonate 5-triphosphate synthase subunit PhnH [Roseivivax jejudonensis]|uniref:Alpha-D-ribose 1-methylphosphonate 5-triphosphate synthase subunit PhnH n=1 Tax=Roseivivax jejudonensis TaxID=1529041 RepID=A0A1X6ZU92_9RHOB|nr:phosphonate C-P lyase system protein PhnH [Roseivivax jejudonensis]SLN61181.1 Alpha-D-ribose 1-methylphosphonate 5-triphosphate synthase subunit PhnH [Roseivivax jejudonensis]